MIALAWGLGGFVLGAILGSFIATLCLRWPEGQSIARGRSRCDGCGKTIPAHDLIPLVSAWRAKGQARCCGTVIDPLHAKVEWAAAAIGGLSLALSPDIQGATLALFGWLLLPLFVLDSRHYWLPDRLTFLLGISGIGLGGHLSGVSLTERIATAFVSGGSLWLIGLAYRRLRGRDGLGAGDPKLLAAIALWLGPLPTVATVLGAAIIGIAEALWKRRAADSAQPFGAFLCLAAFLVALAAVTARAID